MVLSVIARRCSHGPVPVKQNRKITILQEIPASFCATSYGAGREAWCKFGGEAEEGRSAWALAEFGGNLRGLFGKNLIKWEDSGL